MAVLSLPQQVLSMSAQTVSKLVKGGDGDSALLYLALLESGGDVERSGKKLNWQSGRLTAAFDRLAAMGLVEGAPSRANPAPPVPVSPPKEVEEPLPRYTQGDIAGALSGENAFRGLYQEMERLLGRVFTDNDLRSLYTIYDYLAMPVEVILMLTGYMISSGRRQRGETCPPPRMSEVKKEAFRWKRLGVDTVEQAEEYLRGQEAIDQREWEILSAIGVSQPRPAVAREREYIGRWIQWGFSQELIRAAYERTVFQKGGMNWPYMSRILESWHKSGYTTLQQVLAERAPRRGGNTAQPQGSTDYQPSRERIQKNSDWLDKFLEEQEKGG